MSFAFRTPRRAAVAAAGAAAAVVLLAGCSAGGTGSEENAGEPVSGGNLVYATGDAEPTCLDPHVGGNYPQALAASQYLEPLVSKNDDGEIIRGLPASGRRAKTA